MFVCSSIEELVGAGLDRDLGPELFGLRFNALLRGQPVGIGERLQNGANLKIFALDLLSIGWAGDDDRQRHAQKKAPDNAIHGILPDQRAGPA